MKMLPSGVYGQTISSCEKAVVLGTARIPHNPIGIRMSLEPAWRDHGEAIERITHRLPGHLDPVEGAHSGEDPAQRYGIDCQAASVAGAGIR